jgi:serine/threonine protein kinase
MDNESSSFDNHQNATSLISSFSDVVSIAKNGATSDCFKVRIYAKWHFLKRPKKEFTGNPIYIAAFEKEFDLGFTLDHPNIVRYISKGSDKQGLYILTEYIDGLTLNDFRQQNIDFFKKEENIRKILLQILSALDYLHNRQIVHLDLKPENILITNNGNNVKLIDLGLSYSDCYSEITGGTRAYGSPEQFTLPHIIDYRSDIYAFGKIVLFLFTGGTTIHFIKKLPVRYKGLVKKCLNEDINQRNISASACIRLINKKKNKSILFASIVIIAFVTLFVWFFQSKQEINSNLLSKETSNDTISIKRNSIKKVAIITAQLIKRTHEENKETKASLDHRIKTDSRIALEKLITVINTIPEINDDNYATAKFLWNGFANNAESCCRDYLYPKYKNRISYKAFEEIYAGEMDSVITPFREKLLAYKKKKGN